MLYYSLDILHDKRLQVIIRFEHAYTIESSLIETNQRYISFALVFQISSMWQVVVKDNQHTPPPPFSGLLFCSLGLRTHFQRHAYIHTRPTLQSGVLVFFVLTGKAFKNRKGPLQRFITLLSVGYECIVLPLSLRGPSSYFARAIAPLYTLAIIHLADQV